MSSKPDVLYHATTQRKSIKYKQTGFIKSPVRGFTTLTAAMFWSMKVGRKIIYQINIKENKNIHKLPGHQNQFGEAWWYDGNINVEDIKCVVSAI